MTNSVFMPSSGHQGVNDRALQESILEDRIVVCGETRCGSFYSNSLILRLYLFISMEELSMTEEIIRGRVGLILLVHSHFMKYTLSKLYK